MAPARERFHSFSGVSPLRIFDFLRATLLTLTTLSVVAQEAASLEPRSPEAASLDAVRPFLQQHCNTCHGAQTQENDRRFDTLRVELTTVDAIQRWQEILDVLNRGEMPPQDHVQPDAEEVASVVETLTVQLRQAYARQRSTGGQAVARRLNRFELRNTVRDLLSLHDPELRINNVARLVDNNGNGSVENTSTDPFRAFPQDEEEAGFDNIGNRLVMSDFLLQLMLDAAEESLALATETGPRPSVEPRRFAAHLQKQPRGDLERLSREQNPSFDEYFRRETIAPDALRGGVGTSARYRITVEISGHRQQHPWGAVITNRQSQPLQLLLRLFKTRTRDEHIPLKLLEVPGDGQPRTFSVETWIDARWTPQLLWENGPTTREARSDLLVKQFLPDKYREPPDRKQIPDKKQYEEARARWTQDMTATALANYQGPSIRVHRLTLEPLIDAWPPPHHTALYGSDAFDPNRIQPLLLRFAQRAYRRPVSPDEIAPFVELVRAQLTETPDALPRTIQDLTFRSYQGSWSKLPEFAELKPEKQGNIADGLVDIELAGRDEHFGMVFDGTLQISQTARYDFQLASDDGSRLSIDGITIIEHDGLHGASLRKGSAKLTKGIHSVRIEYFAYGKPNSLVASWSGPTFSDAPLAKANAARKQPIVVDDATAQGIKAMQVGYAAILCSPDFLYLREQSDRLNNYEVAARLSYFLWSSMPDEELFALAQSGRLLEPTVLQQQVDRMLADPKSSAFTRHFTERWLRLDKLAESPPELNGPFRIYWDRKMEPQIVAQTDAYFADLVRSNGPIRSLIDSDYTFMNESIADVFYGRKDVQGVTLRKVATNDPRRGGLLTQPAIMTATANGVDTSPVVRGVWVLENILGTPPSPPPPDVEPLSPDLRNAKTIREQLDVHRQQEACNRCHRKIDPLGFPFENFDPIGRWRDRYRSGVIDPKTTMADGREVDNIVAFKQLLLTREDDITRCLTEKLLSYASGRILEPLDRGEVDRIVSELKEQSGGLRDLLKLVVTSRVFLNK